MRIGLVIIVLAILLSAPFAPAEMSLIVAPWGSGYGQYGGLFLPGGGRQGPQSLGLTPDGFLLVLDTFNQGRAIIYNLEGDLLGLIPNEHPSPGYGEIEIEADRFLYLLDLSRQGVNAIDLTSGTQSYRSSTVLGASGVITFMEKDLRGKVFVRDSNGRDLALDPDCQEPLLTMEVIDADKPSEKRLRWRNTSIEFTITGPGPIETVRFLGQLPTGEILLAIETRQDSGYQWTVARYAPDGWTRQGLYHSQPPSPQRFRKPIVVDPAGYIYQIVPGPQEVRIQRWREAPK